MTQLPIKITTLTESTYISTDAVMDYHRRKLVVTWIGAPSGPNQMKTKYMAQGYPGVPLRGEKHYFQVPGSGSHSGGQKRAPEIRMSN